MVFISFKWELLRIICRFFIDWMSFVAQRTLSKHKGTWSTDECQPWKITYWPYPRTDSPREGISCYLYARFLKLVPSPAHVCVLLVQCVYVFLCFMLLLYASYIAESLLDTVTFGFGNGQYRLEVCVCVCAESCTCFAEFNGEVARCLLAVDFSIMVLSSGSWPFQQSASFTLPTEVSDVWLLDSVGSSSICSFPYALQISETTYSSQ